MFVIKRNGQREDVAFDKITLRLKKLCEMEPKLPDEVDYRLVSQKVINGVFPGVMTKELDVLASETAAYMSTTHPGYADLASRIVVSNLHKETCDSFSEVMEKEYNNNSKIGERAPLISEETMNFVLKHRKELDAYIDYNRDYFYDFFGFKTLEKSYLVKISGRTVERPQHMLMRVSIGIHGDNLEMIFKTYDYMSCGWFIHATPTLFNAGTPTPQMSSCFLLAMKEDSIEGIYETVKQTALISKSAGGIGVSIHNIRASASYIRGTNGHSNGIVPMLKVFNDTARYVDQCFDASTVVYTKTGPKRISELEAGKDMVMTHVGKYQRVNKVLAHEVANQDTLSIATKHSSMIVKLTTQHQVLCLKNEQGMTFDDLKERLPRGLVSTEWVDASELCTQDFLCFPCVDDSSVKDLDWMTQEDCNFYGLLVRSGYMSRVGFENDARLSLDCRDTHIIDFVRNYLGKLCAIDFKESVDSNGTMSATTFSWNRKSYGFKFLPDHIYDESGVKIIHEDFMSLPRTKLFMIIWGIVAPYIGAERDANLIGETREENSSTSDVIVELSSCKVVESLRYLLLRCDIVSYIHNVDRNERRSIGIPSNQREVYYLGIPRVKIFTSMFDGVQSGKNDLFFVHDGMIYTPIESISHGAEKYTGTLYDLEVEEDHTYVTEIGIAHNGGGKRKGAFSMYLEPWHADVRDFLQLKKNHGKEEQRARDLFYALWIPDLFMKRVEANQEWSLFCPAEAPGLHECWGEEFEKLYERYEAEGRARVKVKAQDLWFEIIDSQIETGTPYMLYKDSCNRKSNQQNLGTIKCSNLCTEIIEYTSADEIAVCNLASIALPKFVRPDKTFDYDELFKIVYHVVGNLNSVIDRNFYPLEQAKRSNMRHRPVGLGVQGMADVFIKMRVPFESASAAETNKLIFETIYFAALTCSKDLAKVHGPYETFAGSPVSKGILQYDMWGVKPSGRWNWNELKKEIGKYGVRNSLLLAPMPTASTSQILGNNEACEPYTSNIYTRRVLAGEFVVLNRHLIDDLFALGLWTDDVKNQIIADRGSVENVPEIPDSLKELYKTVWEIKQRKVIDMAADRGAFIDQSQSMNAFIANPTPKQLTSMHFYAWKKGLKTGMYYLRTRPAADAVSVTIDPKMLKKRTNEVVTSSSSWSSHSSPLSSSDTVITVDRKPSDELDSGNASAKEPTDGEICRKEEDCLVCGS